MHFSSTWNNGLTKLTENLEHKGRPAIANIQCTESIVGAKRNKWIPSVQKKLGHRSINQHTTRHYASTFNHTARRGDRQHKGSVLSRDRRHARGSRAHPTITSYSETKPCTPLTAATNTNPLQAVLMMMIIIIHQYLKTTGNRFEMFQNIWRYL